MLGRMVLSANQEVAIRIRTTADLTGLRGLGRSVNSLRSELNHLAIGFAVLGAGAAATVNDIVKTVRNFETQINRVQAAANATSREIGALRNQAKLLGRQTAFTASQAAEAQFRLAQSGYEVNETLRLMPDVLNVAAAGLLSMEESGRILTNQIASYNLHVDEATRISDVLALTAASAKTSISELGTTFRYAGPSAAAVGISFEETAAAIGILRDRGLVAEQAGTGLRFNILRLVRPVASAAAVFKELGISQEETAKKIEAGKLLEVFKEFGDAGMTLNQAGRMFDVRAAGSALILAHAAEEAMALKDALLGAEGASKRMAETQMQGLPGALLRMTSAIESMKIALGEAGLTTVIIHLAEWVRQLANFVGNLPGPVRTVIVTMLLLATALAPLAGLIFGIVFAYRAFRTMGMVAKALKGELATESGRLGAAEQTLATAANQAAAAHRGLASSMNMSGAAMDRAGAAAKRAVVGYRWGGGLASDVAAAPGMEFGRQRGRVRQALVNAGWVRGETMAETDARRAVVERRTDPARVAQAQHLRNSLNQARRQRDADIESTRARTAAQRNRDLQSEFRRTGQPRTPANFQRWLESGSGNAIAGQQEAIYAQRREQAWSSYAARRSDLARQLDERRLSDPLLRTRMPRGYTDDFNRHHRYYTEDAATLRRRRSAETRERNYQSELDRQRRSPIARAFAQTASARSARGRVLQQMQSEAATTAATARQAAQRMHQTFIPTSEMLSSGSRSAGAWYTGFNNKARSLVSSSGRTIGNALGLAIGVAGGAVAGAALGERLGGETGQMIGGIAGSILGPAFVLTVGNFVSTALTPLILKMKIFTAAVIANNIAWLANPIVWIPLAIAAIVGGLALLIIHWDKVTAAVKRFLSVIPGVKNLLPKDWTANVDTQQVLNTAGNVTRGIARPLPVAPPGAVNHAVSMNSRNINVQPGAIVVNDQSGDSEETARRVVRQIYAQEREAENLQTTSDFDDNLLR